MCSLPLLLLLLLTSLLIPSTSSSTHANHQENATQSGDTVPPLELETLYKIMETMSSDEKWRISYPNPCSPTSSWPGIQCKFGNDNHFHISRLDFGTFPNPICKNTATFPADIFTLPYLQSAFFYQCFNHIPTAIKFPLISPSSLPSSLQQLSLRSNPSLIGKIPSQISSLKSLKVLTLSQNRLNGQIPPEIFTLTKLIHLDLSYNSLSGYIPLQIGELENLQGLDFSYNSLSGTIPTAIGELNLLQKLDLSSNLLFGKIPNNINKLTSLSFLALSNNKLKDGFSDELRKLVNLQYFIMENNPMSINLPSQFGMLVKLQELRLANCGYFGKIPSTFCQLKNLTTLSLQNNRLSGEIPAGISSLNHIYHLNLSGNFLEGVVPFNESFIKRLGKNLDLSENHGLCFDSKEVNNGSNFITCSKKNYSFIQPSNKISKGFVLFYPSYFVGMLSPILMHFLVFFM